MKFTSEEVNMDINVEKFQKDLKRVCKYYDDCDDCPIDEWTGGCNTLDNLKEIIQAVQKWVEEHSEKE